MSNTPTGQVIKYHSNFYYVDVDGVPYECMLKGVLKKALKAQEDDPSKNIGVAVGDRVTLDSLDTNNHTARIVDIHERDTLIRRPKIANVDQVVLVYSIKEPDLDFNQVDRYLTHIELAKLSPILCISKCDLNTNATLLQQLKTLYTKTLGYPLVFTSIYQEDGFDDLKTHLKGKTSVLAGPSGAGKSSLLNALNPNLQLKVGDVSEKIARGQHTTRHVELLQVLPKTWIADTPGFSHLSMDTVLPQEVEAVFTEFGDLRSQCQFDNCLHMDEVGCAVKDNANQITDSRYNSYQTMVAEAKTFEEQTAEQSSKSEYGYKKLNQKGDKDLTILRLKSKDREASRKTKRQKMSSMVQDVLADPDLLDSLDD